MIRLDSASTARKLPYSDLVRAVALAAHELSIGAVKAPERLVVPIDSNASLLCMPAIGPDLGITKVVTVHQHNTAQGLPAIQGEMIVFDVTSGRRLMLLDGPTVTARRTAAVTLLAIDKLAQSPPQTALLIGTGVQSAAHVEALFDYFCVRAFWIAGRVLQSAVLFSERVGSAHPGITVRPVATPTLEACGVAPDLVIALTTSRNPVVPAHLPNRTVPIGVGAFRPDMVELPTELLKQRRIVVDYLKGAELEGGDLLRADVSWSDVTELSQLRSRLSSSQGFVFKSVGHASWDLAAARVALQN